MNRAILCGRTTKDPVISATGNTTVAKFTLAVDRRFKDADGNYQTDFINCVSFGKAAEFVENYVSKGTKLLVTGRIQTGSYTNKDGQKVYTTDIVTEDIEFAESKRSQNEASEAPAEEPKKETKTKSKPKKEEPEDDFMNISEGEAEDLPW